MEIHFLLQGCSNLQYSDCECTISGKYHGSASTSRSKRDIGRSILPGSIGLLAGLVTSVAGYVTLLYCLRRCADGAISRVQPTRGPWSTGHSKLPLHKPIPTNVYQNAGQSGYRNVYRVSGGMVGGNGTQQDNIRMSYSDATYDW